MRIAPQRGFSRLIFRISLRISFNTGGRPRWPQQTFQAQNSRNTLRCHAMTVAGLTMQRASAIRPRHHKTSPQEPVEPIELRSLQRALQYAKWGAEGDDLKRCNATRDRKTDNVEASNVDNTQPDPNLRDAQAVHPASRSDSGSGGAGGYFAGRRSSRQP
jgi:hypothetical protein